MTKTVAKMSSTARPEFPVDDSRIAKKLALRVRKTYKGVLHILKYAKTRKPRKITVLCSELTNSSTLQYVPRTRLFVDLASLHVSSGKLRKNTYRTLLKAAPNVLAELEHRINQTKHLVREVVDEVPARGKNALQKPKPAKPKFSFNALEDLDRVRKLVVESKTVTEVTYAPATETRPKRVLAVSRKKKGADADQEDIAKSVTEEDALVCDKFNNEREHIQIGIGECKLFKRGVVLFGTHIPPIVWKRVFASMGLQMIAKQYLTAMYASVVAAPAEAGGELLEPEAVANHAVQLLALHNKKQKQDCDKLVLVGDPIRISNATHWWYLAMPVCVVNHPTFRFGKWSFATMPKIGTPKAVAVQ